MQLGGMLANFFHLFAPTNIWFSTHIYNTAMFALHSNVLNKLLLPHLGYNSSLCFQSQADSHPSPRHLDPLISTLPHHPYPTKKNCPKSQSRWQRPEALWKRIIHASIFTTILEMVERVSNDDGWSYCCSRLCYLLFPLPILNHIKHSLLWNSVCLRSAVT